MNRTAKPTRVRESIARELRLDLSTFGLTREAAWLHFYEALKRKTRWKRL
jgi:hypothetical protein